MFEDTSKTAEDCVKALKLVDSLWRPPAFSGELSKTGQLTLHQLAAVQFTVHGQESHLEYARLEALSKYLWHMNASCHQQFFISLQETDKIHHTEEPKQQKKESFYVQVLFGGLGSDDLTFVENLGQDQESSAEKTAEPMQVIAQDAVVSHLECVKYMTIYVKLGGNIYIYIGHSTILHSFPGDSTTRSDR